MKEKILFLYLDAFSVTGGIEKFNKAFMKALQDIAAEEQIKFDASSAYDDTVDKRYINEENFTGYKGKRISFTLNSLRAAFKSDIVILGHINLAVIGLIVKFLKPTVKLILIVHGVEVWEKQPLIKKIFIQKINLFLAVSSFTKSKIVEIHHVPEEKIKILHNTLDPYFKIPDEIKKPEYLLERYKLNRETKILLTVGRINGKEGNKGYDKVINILPELLSKHSTLVYMLAGNYDENEKLRVMKLVSEKKLNNNFILPGYIKDEELTDHYLLGDIFIMPSTQEGFGIVFLEALSCGLSVIAGNKDGSVDALLNGKLGKLVNPDNSNEILNAVNGLLKTPSDNYRDLINDNFGFDRFKKRIRTFLIEN